MCPKQKFASIPNCTWMQSWAHQNQGPTAKGLRGLPVYLHAIATGSYAGLAPHVCWRRLCSGP